MCHWCVISFHLFLAIIVAVAQAAIVGGMKSSLLCSQCRACDMDKCPTSDAYPHMTAFDDTLIAGALQSDYVTADDRGVYSVPNIKGGESTKYNSYFGWESTSGSASGVGVSDCKFDGANPFQLFAFRFHYHKAFCCCGKFNE